MVVKTRSTGDKIFDVINILIMIAIMIITVYPFWYAVVGSLNSGLDYLRGGVNLWPRSFTLANYTAVFQSGEVLAAYRTSVLRTLVGTITYLIVVSMFAYAFSKKYLVGRNIYAGMGLVSLFFEGGIIPMYFVLKTLGILNTFWVYILPGMFHFFGVIIFTSFFREIPVSINESAKIDGAHEYTIFSRLIVPLSKPVYAAMALFTAVWHWNDYRMSLIFTSDDSLEVIQLFLLRVVNSFAQASNMAGGQAAMSTGIREDTTVAITVQLATMVMTAAPILIIYPFLQKYFVKGVLIGSVKE